MMDVGDKIKVSDSNYGEGVIKYVGKIDGLVGQWVGIELNEPLGNSNGKNRGNVYFTCKENFGIFVKLNRLVLIEKSKTPPCKDSILERLTTNQLATILSYLSLQNILNIGILCKSIRQKADSDPSWATIFSRHFPNAKVEDTSNWKLNYKKLYKPLEIQIEITPNELDSKQKTPVQIIYTLINHSLSPMNIIVGIDSNDFQTGRFLLSQQIGNSKQIINKSKKAGSGGICGTFASSQYVIVDKEFKISKKMVAKQHAGRFSLVAEDFLGNSIPLSVASNEVWVEFATNGQYRDNRRTPDKHSATLPFWKGTVRSNKATVKVI